MLNVKPVKILTDEELKEMAEVMETIEGYINSGMEIITAIGMVTKMKEVITSHRALNSRNAKLVHENDELMAENEKLKWICKRSFDFITAMVGFTGSNMQVYGWHLNDSPEPFDNFVEENLEENLITDLKTALEELKHE